MSTYSENTVERYKKTDEIIAREIGALTTQILYYVTPINLKEQRGNLDPKFEYRELDFDVDEKIKKLEEIKIPPGKLYEIYKNTIDELIKRLTLLTYRGNKNKMREYSENVWGRPKESTLFYAKKILEQEEEYSKKNRELTAYDLQQRLCDILFLYGLENWKVELSYKPEVTISRVERKITIGKERHFSEEDIERLIEHEIKVHILRAENAYLQPLKIFLIGFPHYIKTEEGLAIYREYDKGLLDINKLKEYAGRTIAVDLMYKGYGFRDIYEVLREHNFSNEKAWDIAYRVMRGGGLGRDYIYLEGFKEIKEILESKNKEEKEKLLKLLYVGKIGIEHLDLVEDLLNREEIALPHYIPEW